MHEGTQETRVGVVSLTRVPGEPVVDLRERVGFDAQRRRGVVETCATRIERPVTVARWVERRVSEVVGRLEPPVETPVFPL